MYFEYCNIWFLKFRQFSVSLLLLLYSTSAASYRQDRQLREWVRKVMAIGYLPLAVLRQNFRLMQTDRQTRQMLRRYQVLDDFIQYLDNTYVGDNSMFPPAVWNVHGRFSDNRSNNCVEGNNLNITIIIIMNNFSFKIFSVCFSVTEQHKNDMSWALCAACCS